MHRIAIPVTPGLQLFELAIPCEVFEPDREDFPVPWWYELQLCAVKDAPVRTAEGLLFDSSLGLDQLSTADTVIIPGCADRQVEPPEALLQWLCAERVRRAQDLLENTDDTIERIAMLCGFGSAHQLRTHFTRINHVTPHAYQRTFRTHHDVVQLVPDS
jgi:transcriptional regulator GlxA family with amidase domain